MRINCAFRLRACPKSRCAIAVNKAAGFSAIASAIQPEHPVRWSSARKSRQESRELVNILQSHSPYDFISFCRIIHGKGVVRGLESDVYFANVLFSSYSKSNNLHNAQVLFCRMCCKNSVSLSTMVSMYTRHGYPREALMMFSECIKNAGMKLNKFVLSSIISACTQFGTYCEGAQMHGIAIKIGVDEDIHVGTSLVEFYSKIGEIDKGRYVFHCLPEKTVVTWTCMMAGYMSIDAGEVALKLFVEMQETDIVPDRFILSTAVTVCSMLEFLEGGKQIHAYSSRREPEMNVLVSNVLINFYTKCGRVSMGMNVFNQMVAKNVISWTTMISGYVQNNYDSEATDLFVEMTKAGLKPDDYACTSILSSSGSLHNLPFGMQVHCYSLKVNLDGDGFVKNSLIYMYSKCDSLDNAVRVFSVKDNNNVVAYNTLIEAFSRHEMLNQAVNVFNLMRFKAQPNRVTFIGLLRVANTLYSVEVNRQIHGVILKFGMFIDVFAGSALIDVYSKCSLLHDARQVFNEMLEKGIVVWNAMLFGYGIQMQNEKALDLYSEFRISELCPNEFTYVALVSIAGNMASLRHGLQFHAQLVKCGLVLDRFIVNALVDMYAKCGSIEEANKAFSFTDCRDVLCWNSLLSTYAQHGEVEVAFEVFDRMKKSGKKPSYATFVSILSACSHAGWVDDGIYFFKQMYDFGITPGIDHYACVVSLLARTGNLYEAKDFIERMPIKPTTVMWKSLLSACMVDGNIELGKYAAEMALSLDREDSGSYTLLSNILASKGMWSDVNKVREEMDFGGVVKNPGCSW